MLDAGCWIELNGILSYHILVRLVSPFNGELSFIMDAVLWSDRFVNKTLRNVKHRTSTCNKEMIFISFYFPQLFVIKSVRPLTQRPVKKKYLAGYGGRAVGLTISYLIISCNKKLISLKETKNSQLV